MSRMSHRLSPVRRYRGSVARLPPAVVASLCVCVCVHCVGRYSLCRPPGNARRSPVWRRTLRLAAGRREVASGTSPRRPDQSLPSHLSPSCHISHLCSPVPSQPVPSHLTSLLSRPISARPVTSHISALPSHLSPSCHISHLYSHVAPHGVPFVAVIFLSYLYLTDFPPIFHPAPSCYPVLPRSVFSLSVLPSI